MYPIIALTISLNVKHPNHERWIQAKRCKAVIWRPPDETHYENDNVKIELSKWGDWVHIAIIHCYIAHWNEEDDAQESSR